ncbi:hypothetical protein RND71_008305 [Anisodus tanguticus]|uniref:Uncharacterized protein n=1 Tax=Anisodus tanguticus TaxID=243964 RepID=A0AAE1SQL0_9SOLA|nr:hypothetical protein RND71_008305 [Anisodus tanguticus]
MGREAEACKTPTNKSDKVKGDKVQLHQQAIGAPDVPIEPLEEFIERPDYKAI